MSDLKTQIANFINENREKGKPLSDKSMKAYTSTLLNLYHQVFTDIEEFDINRFNDHKAIINYLKDTPHSTRKTKMATLLNIATDKKARQEYQKIMNKDVEKYNKEQDKNKATEAQKAVNITQEDIHKIGDQVKQEFNKTIKELTEGKPYGAYTKIDLLKHIIYMLTSGEYIPPRRIMEWVELKIGKVDKRSKKHTKLNYNLYNPKNGEFVMNVYKTADTMGTQYIKAPKAMKDDINKYIELNGLKDGDYLITDKDGHPLTISTFNKRLNGIYGDHRGVNVLRHSFVTEKYQNIPSLQELSDTADAMGHGILQHLEYIKN